MADTRSSENAMAGLEQALKERYRFERLLGEGGMATVHLAQDLRTNSPVAIKVLRPELAASLDPGLDGLARSLAFELEHHWAFDPITMEKHDGFYID